MEQVYYLLTGNDLILPKAGKPKWRFQLEAEV